MHALGVPSVTSEKLMRTYEYQGSIVHVAEFGAGLPVMLLHAGGSSSRQWRRMGELLQDDFRLIAPDLLSFGQTGPWNGQGMLTHDIQADMVASIIEKTCDGPVPIVGHSYGGATAMRLWVAHPEMVSCLILIEPLLTVLLAEAGEANLFEEYKTFAENFMNKVEAGRIEEAWHDFLDMRNGEGTWAALAADARKRFLDQSTQAADAFRANLANPTTLSDCHDVSVPTLVMLGAETTAPDRRCAEIVRDAIPACTYAVIPEAGHMAPLSHPKDVAALVRENLS